MNNKTANETGQLLNEKKKKKFSIIYFIDLLRLSTTPTTNINKHSNTQVQGYELSFLMLLLVLFLLLYNLSLYYNPPISFTCLELLNPCLIFLIFFAILFNIF